MGKLLPTNTLLNVRLGISASPSGDLARLGLTEDHFRLALGELARTVLVLGGGLQYCGHLDSKGYTTFLISELKRFGRTYEPLSILLAWSVHRRLRLNDIRSVQNDLGLLGRITCLDPSGAPVDCAANREDFPPGVPDDEIGPSLSAMRRAAIRETQGRLLIGGRRSGYQGEMPGVMEEALLSIAGGKPVFLAGGFGGVTHDIVRTVDENAAAWFFETGRSAVDLGWKAGVKALSEALAGRGWGALFNGLDESENIRLAATHRPSEIAALVSVGLGRLAQQGLFKDQ
jgi:hypothetical protein